MKAKLVRTPNSIKVFIWTEEGWEISKIIFINDEQIAVEGADYIIQMVHMGYRFVK